MLSNSEARTTWCSIAALFFSLYQESRLSIPILCSKTKSEANPIVFIETQSSETNSSRADIAASLLESSPLWRSRAALFSINALIKAPKSPLSIVSRSVFSTEFFSASMLFSRTTSSPSGESALRISFNALSPLWSSFLFTASRFPLIPSSSEIRPMLTSLSTTSSSASSIEYSEIFRASSSSFTIPVASSAPTMCHTIIIRKG